ncbi:hypothetical protein C2E23DRAFT_881304 [Lenzites betulinus]|nr:hypothetical protein C2E23DRAFT_881304 [Lenzites betulinus]
MAGVNHANTAISGLTIAGRKVLVRQDYDEPKHCSRCQEYASHFARDCKAPHDVCANCAGTHATAQCPHVGNPLQHRCANCKESGHAAWDRACPMLRAWLYFVTNAPETWVSDEEELARAPPPPTVWSQVRHHFDTVDAAPRLHASQQGTLDAFYGTPE